MKEIKLIHSDLCGKILNQTQIIELSEKKVAISSLTQIQKIVGGDLRISNQGVPHLLYPNNIKPLYSICYFKKSKLYKVFYPYPSIFGKQNRINFLHYTQVINYLTKNA